jgi:hypothetical protein
LAGGLQPVGRPAAVYPVSAGIETRPPSGRPQSREGR